MWDFIGMKGKNRLTLGATCLFFIFLSACGFNDFDKTTLEFDKDGSIVLHIREVFDENLYDYDELCGMNEAEVAGYNADKGSEEVKIKDSRLDDGQLKIDLLYTDDDAYYDMNGYVLFYGSCKEARSAGYNLVEKVSSTSNGEKLNQKTWKNMSEEMVAIVSESIDVQMPDDILYIGEGVTLIGANSASVNDGSLRYIISK